MVRLTIGMPHNTIYDSQRITRSHSHQLTHRAHENNGKFSVVYLDVIKNERKVKIAVKAIKKDK